MLTIDPDEQRFDGTVRDHGHFRCVRCGAVTDFPVDYAAALAEFPPQAMLMTRELFCTGVCAGLPYAAVIIGSLATLLYTLLNF